MAATPTPESPTPETAKPDKRKAKPSHVLVENRRHGILVAHEVDAKSPTGEDPRTGQRTYDVKTHNLHPGLNLVPADVWDRFGKSLEKRIEESEVVVHDGWTDVRRPAAEAAIKNTGDVAVLRKLLEGEERKPIVDALEKQITLCERGGLAVMRARGAHSVG